MILSAAALVAVAVGVIALLQGGEDSRTVTPDAVAEAAERTTRVDGVRYSLEGETDVPRHGRVPFTGHGVSDIAGERGTAHIDMSEFAKHAGEGEAADPDSWKMDMVFDRRSFYMKFPLLEPELDGKSWAKFDLLEVSEAAGIDPALIRAEQQQGSDPAGMLRYLRAVSDDVERLGTEQVRGVESTHYRATIELRKYPNLAPAEDREAVRRSVDRLIELNGDDTMNTEIWVGDDKMIRRMKWEQSMKTPGTEQIVRSSYTAEYYDFGTDVRIEPPPDDEVKDITREVAAQLAAERRSAP